MTKQPARQSQEKDDKGGKGKGDPSVRHLKGAAPEYPEGTHPPHPPSEQTWGPDRFSYSEMPEEDKPDKSTVANVLDSDPVTDKAQDALREAAESPAKPVKDEKTS